MTTLKFVAGIVCLLALAGAMNVLTWWGIQRTTPGRPWHWTAVLGAFAYHPWLNRQERIARDAESAARCAKTERLLADLNARAASITRRHYWRQDPTTGMFYAYHEDPPEDLNLGIYAEIMWHDALPALPWDDPNHDVVADFRAAIHRAETEPYPRSSSE